MQLNAILTQNTVENFVDGLIYDELVTLDAAHRHVPDLAAAVPTLENGGISRDGLTITYHLRHGVRWHDGAPFTSKDVKFTWQAVMNPANNVVSRRGYDQVASMDTPDDFTVVMHMKHIFPPAIDSIFGESDGPYRILPAHLLAHYPNINQVPFNGAPVGTGPFKFASWARGDRINLVANPSYFRGTPKLKTLTLLIVQDDNTVGAQLRSHELDVGLQITGPTFNALRTVPGIVTALPESPTYTGFIFNTRRPPLDDIRVRRALVMGMDRAAIVRDDTYGTARLGIADLAPFSWAFDAGVVPVPYDLAGAKSLLDAAGWQPGPDGVRVNNGQRLSLQLIYGQGSQLARTVTAQVQQMYRPLGVEVELKSYDYAMLYAAAQNGGILMGGKFDITLWSWTSGADPDDSSQWTCAAIPPPEITWPATVPRQWKPRSTLRFRPLTQERESGPTRRSSPCSCAIAPARSSTISRCATPT
jgi:peptide/nickel transport system substrate-binding protein